MLNQSLTRKIIHLDLDAFYCAVEELRDPSLRGKAFAVGGRPSGRGVVTSASYAARRFGVRSAMPMARAMRLCPGLLVVPTRFAEYGRVSGEVMARLRALTPLVEQLSVDEAFLEVTNRSEYATQLARQLQTQIREELGLPASLGVATNKLVAKIANNVGKAAHLTDGDGSIAHALTMRSSITSHTPNALTVVLPGAEAEFLAPLPVGELWGVGPSTAEKLRALGMETIGDIARWDEIDLAQRFGKHGASLARRARGIDNRPIVTEREAKSISRETTFARDVDDPVELRRVLGDLSQQVSERLRRKSLAGKTVQIKLRWPDFTTPTRQTTLPVPVADARTIHATAVQLFDELWRDGPNASRTGATGAEIDVEQAVRLIGVGVSGFVDGPRQLGFWDEPVEWDE